MHLGKHGKHERTWKASLLLPLFASMFLQKTPNKATGLQGRGSPHLGPLRPQIIDRKRRRASGMVRTEIRKGSNPPNSALAVFPKRQGWSSQSPAHPFPTSGHKGGKPGGWGWLQRQRAGRDASPAPADALTCPGSPFRMAHLPEAAARRPPRSAPSRPRPRRALASGRPFRSAPPPGLGPGERTPGSSPAPATPSPPRLPSPAAPARLP